MSEGLVITSIGGLCPVQAEGTVLGMPFYFRSRYSEWSFSVGSEPISDDINFFVSGEYPGEEFDAGYMPVEEAKAIIEALSATFIALRTSIRGANNE